MSHLMADRELYLCGGPQSSGSTLISWCFLQRQDMDGVLDANNDVLAEIPASLRAPLVWFKTTISGFRLSEWIEHYQDEGWQVRPLLVCRDVRAIFASLSTKHYGRNGTTAEDPPLRMRLRRFKADWDLFRRQDWPILVFENFLAEPEMTLRAACDQLRLPWDPGMLTWPKTKEQIANTRHGNKTFHSSRTGGMVGSLQSGRRSAAVHRIPVEDLAWLEAEFHDFNLEHGYPLHLTPRNATRTAEKRAIPRYERTRRLEWVLRRKPFRWLWYKLGLGEARKRSA